MKIVLFIFFFFLNMNTYAQKEDINWTIHNNLLINFNTSPPIVSANIGYIKLGISCVSDKNGNLLFYGDCDTVFNKNNEAIYNLPSPLSRNERSIIIPLPEIDNLFYMFITASEDISRFFVIQLLISIDNAGLAHLVNSNILESSNTHRYPFLISMRHANNKDFWLLLNGEQDNQIKSYLITNSGISLQNTSTLISNININQRNALKSSPDLQSIVYANHKKINILDFNCQNGSVENLQSIVLDGKFLTFEFSPNSQKIIIPVSKNDTTQMMQYSMNLIRNPQQFLSSGVVISKYKTQHIMGDMQIAYDNKIYTITLSREYLGVIENPDMLPPICYFNKNGLYLKGKTAGWIFPNFIRYHSNFSYKSICGQIKFALHGVIPQSVLWDFGDSQTSTELEPTHTYANAGIYTITLTVTYNDNSTNTISKQITIYNKPIQPTILHD